MSNLPAEKSNNESVSTNALPNLASRVDVSGNSNIVSGYVNHLTIVNQKGTPTQRTVNNAYSNIFVLKGKTYSGGCFSVLKNRVTLNGMGIDSVTSYPSLFVIANDEYTKCSNPEQQFFYGFVTEVEDENRSYKICYEIRSTQLLLQTDLNRVAVKLGITPVKGRDVLGETGWTVCPIDIVKEMADEGISLTAY